MYYYDPNGVVWTDDIVHETGDTITFYDIPTGGYLSIIPFNAFSGQWGEQAYSVPFLAENGRKYKYDVAGTGVYYA